MEKREGVGRAFTGSIARDSPEPVMPRGTTLLVAGLAALAGCSKRSEGLQAAPGPSASASGALARAAAMPAPSGVLATTPAETEEDARIIDPDALITRGWERHREGKDARTLFARASEKLQGADPSRPADAGPGPGPIEGMASTPDGIMSAIKVARGVLFFRTGTGTVTGWRDLPGTLAERGGIAFHPVRPMLTVVLRAPRIAVRIVDSHTMGDLPGPVVDRTFLPAVSPSGTRLAYLQSGALHLLDIDANKDRYAPLAQPADTMPGAVLFAPDTRSFAVVDVNKLPPGRRNVRLRLVDATDGRVVLDRALEPASDGGDSQPPAMDFAADAATFRFVDPKGKLVAVDRATGAIKPATGQPPSNAAPPPVTVPALDATTCHAHGRVMPAGMCP